MSASAPQALPSLDRYRVVLFDLDGVLTPTADLHMHAWRVMFEELFAEKGVAQPYTDDDYFVHLDGKQRYEGVSSILRSRGIELDWGFPTDPTTADTVCGIGNRKNDVFSRVLLEEGVQPYPGSLALLDQLRAKGVPLGIVSSSKNAETVLTAAGIRDRFPVVVDGIVAARETLGSKPSPDMFAHAAEALGVGPEDAAVFEDAISGVAAARAGNFALVVGVDRGVGPAALFDAGADVVVADLGEFVEVAE
jgi:beta-phosphoglucomutase family hydrolase